MATASDVPVAAKVKESVKETLLGTEEPAQLSAHTQATFMKHAHHDEASGELVMTEPEFVDAIAPEKEDYVSCTPDTRRWQFDWLMTHTSTKSSVNNMRYSSAWRIEKVRAR